MKAIPSSVVRKIIRLKAAPAPVVQTSGAPAPVALSGLGDQTELFRSMILRTQRDGSDLVVALDRMIVVAPLAATEIILAGSLGRVSQARAVTALRTYRDTRVALAVSQVL